MEVVGNWKYHTKDGQSFLYSIEFGFDGQLCFRQSGNHGSCYGRLEQEVDQDNILWLKSHLRDEHTGSKEGQIWVRYDQEEDTIHSKFVSTKCVTAVRSKKDAIKLTNLSLQTRVPRSLTTSAHIEKNSKTKSIMTETSRPVLTRNLGSFDGGAMEMTRDLASFQGGSLEMPWTYPVKERECSVLLFGFLASRLFSFLSCSRQRAKDCIDTDIYDVMEARGKEGVCVSDQNKSI